MGKERNAALALAATTFVWGSTFIVIRDLVADERGQGIPPLLLVSTRFAIATLATLAALLATGAKMEREAWRRGIVLGLVTAGGFAFQSLGLRFTTPSRSAFITNISLLMVPVFGMALGRKRPGAAVWLGSLVALGGLWLLEFPWDRIADAQGDAARQATYLRGDILTLGCATFFALQILATEAFSPKTQLLPLAFAQFLTCGVVTGLVGLSLGEAGRIAMPTQDLLGRCVAEILYLGFVATTGCLLVQVWAQRHISATRAALIFMLETVFAALLAYLLFGERLTGVQWGGAVLVFLGVLAAELI